MQMRLYYIAYNFGHDEIQMIDGPYGTSLEAEKERENMLIDMPDDEKLIVVSEVKDVQEVWYRKLK